MEWVSVFDDHSWTAPFEASTVIYILRWAGKEYVGGTSRLHGRMGDWRKYARRNRIADIRVRVLLVCSLSDKEYYERRCVEQYNTYTTGHNKSPSGTNVGIKMHPKTAASIRAAHLGKPAHPNSMAALIRANTGRVHSEEVRKNMREGAKNRPPVSEETRKKMSEAHLRRRTLKLKETA